MGIQYFTFLFLIIVVREKVRSILTPGPQATKIAPSQINKFVFFGDLVLFPKSEQGVPKSKKVRPRYNPLLSIIFKHSDNFRRTVVIFKIPVGRR